MKKSTINDIDIKNWKNRPEIITDSLWLIDKNKPNSYHGHFVDELPRQFCYRFMKKGELLLDPFVGSGTTLIEAKLLEIDSVGIDIQDKMVIEAQQKADAIQSKAFARCFDGDSSIIDYQRILSSIKKKTFQGVILHPPYFNIIKFSNIQDDLSQSSSVNLFLDKMKIIVENFSKFLDKDRYVMLVIGDYYFESQWQPLAFKTMETIQNCGYILKSICIKDQGNTLAKRNQNNLWRVRALKGGYYIFKHEYVMFFKKV